MLDSMRKGQRWLTLIFVTLVGAVFVFFMGTGGGLGGRNRPSGNNVVEIDDIHMDSTDFTRMRARQEEAMREQLGDGFDARTVGPFLDSQALRMMVDSAVMSTAAAELGLHVSKAEIQRGVRESGAFRDESGRFSPELFDQFARREYGSQRTFIETYRQDLLRQRLLQLLYRQVSVSDAEVDLATRYELEEIGLTLLVLDPGDRRDDIELSDDEVSAWLADNEPAVRAVYDGKIDEYREPEQVKARHILIQVSPTAGEEQKADARSRAEGLRARALAGEDFAALAKEFSEDPGTKDDGGDLGFFARGDNAPELEAAAFALQPGDLSEVIESDAGFHVIKVEEKKAASEKAFESVSLELARSLAAEAKADEQTRALAEKIASAIEAGSSLEDAARAEELTLERPPTFRRRPDGFVPGLGAAPDVMAAAFVLGDAGTSSPRIFDIGDRLVLIQIREKHPVAPERMVDERDERRDQLLARKRQTFMQDWIDEARTRLEAEGRLKVNAELVLGNG